jgi:hypothetical protein
MKKEPIRHHYIPQFILRNFCFNDKSNLFFFDKKTSKILIKNTKDIFMVKNLYRDDINNPDEPVKIEKDLARFENEISQIITKKFLYNNEITISLEDDEKIKLFFAVMAFRSNGTRRFFTSKMSEESKAFYFTYQKNGDLTDFWKRNLSKLVNCRSLKDIIEHTEIDFPIKAFFQRDILGLFGLYFIVVERRGPLDFIISDVYPTVISGELDDGLELPLYNIFPISPDRTILIASNGIESAPKNIIVLPDNILKKPKLNSIKKEITIPVRKIYEDEVRYLNSILIKEAFEGFAFQTKHRVILPT